MEAILPCQRFGPAEGTLPSQLIILLHGLGADGNDLIGLAPQLGRFLPLAQFIAPDAPFPYDLMPMGRQWFSIKDRGPDHLHKDVKEAATILNNFIDFELTRTNLPPRKLALVGFSQGTMMAMYVAFRRPEPISAILGFSGRLIANQELSEEIRAYPPTLLIHGNADPVVPFEALSIAEITLKKLGVPVRTIERQNVGHTIDEVGINRGGQFLKDIFNTTEY